MSTLADIGSYLFGNGTSTGDTIKNLGSIVGGGLSVADILSGKTPQQQAASSQTALGNQQLDVARQILADSRDTTAYTKGIANKAIGNQEGVIGATYAPITDARGNTYTYTPGKGYQASLSARSGQLQDASDSEALSELLHDLPQYRAGLDANAARRGDEGTAASGMLQQVLGNKDPYSLGGMQDDFLTQATKGVNDAYKDETGRVESQALRSGTGDAPLLNALMKQRASDTTDAILKARTQAPAAYESAETSRQGRLNSQFGNYNTIAGRASNIGTEPSFSPSTITSDANSTLNSLRNGLGVASNAANSEAQAGSSAGQVGAQNTFAANPAFATGVQALSNANSLGTNLPDPLATAGSTVNGIAKLFGNSNLGTTPTKAPSLTLQPDALKSLNSTLGGTTP